MKKICGAPVLSKKTKFTTTYQGKEFYFCTKHCLDRFNENPEKFLESKHAVIGVQ